MMRRAGFPDTQLVQGVAIAIAESSLKVNAKNEQGTVDHIGLFQIAGDKGFDNAKLESDPQYNVNAAYQVWKRQGWSRGWLMWENGASLKHMTEAAAGVATSRKKVPNTELKGWNVHSDDISVGHEIVGAVPGGDTVYEGVQSAAGGVGDIVGALGKLDTWTRAGEVLAGTAMFLIGAVLLARIST